MWKAAGRTQIRCTACRTVLSETFRPSWRRAITQVSSSLTANDVSTLSNDLRHLERLAEGHMSLDSRESAMSSLSSERLGLLSKLSDEQAASLATMVAQRHFGTLVEQLLEQLEKDSEDSREPGSSILQASSGTTRRVRILKGLLSGALRGRSMHAGWSMEQVERIVQLLRVDMELHVEQGTDRSAASDGMLFLPPRVSSSFVRSIIKEACASGLPGLLPLVLEAQAFLRSQATFLPSNEGADLLRYFLLPDVSNYARTCPHPGTASGSQSHLAEQLVLITFADLRRSPTSITDELLMQAREEGQAWVNWAEDVLESREAEEGPLDIDDRALQSAAFEVTARSVVLRLLLRDTPTSAGETSLAAEQALSELVHALTALSMSVTTANGQENLLAGTPAIIARRHATLFLTLLVANGPQNPSLLTLFVRVTKQIACGPLALSLASLDVQLLVRFITTSIRLGRTDEGVSILVRGLRESADRQSIMASIPPAALISMLKKFATPARQRQLREIFEAMTQAGVSAFPEELRPNLITTLAKAEMHQEVQLLYEDSVRAEEQLGATAYTGQHSGVAIAVVRLFVRRARQLSKDGPNSRSAAMHEFASRVYERHVDAVPPDDRSHYNITTMAACCVQLGDPEGALAHFQLLAARRTIPDAVDISVLLSATMSQPLGPDRAVKLFIEAVDQPSPVLDRLGLPRSLEMVDGDGDNHERSPAGLQPTAVLYSTLMAHCYRARRPDLAAELYAHASTLGLGNQLGVRALDSIMANTRQSPRAVSAQISYLVEREGWKPEPRLLSWIAGCFASGQYPADVSRDDPRPLHLPPSRWLLAALSIYHTSVRASQQAHLRTAELLLQKLRAKGHYIARLQAKKAREVRGAWIRRLDKVVSSLRWTPKLVLPDVAWQEAGDTGEGESTFEGLVEMAEEDTVEPSPIGEAGRRKPNPLPLATLHLVAVAYIDMHDFVGAAEVVRLMREQGFDVPVRPSSHTRQTRKLKMAHNPAEGEGGDADEITPVKKVREVFDSPDDGTHLEALGDLLWRKSPQDKRLRRLFEGKDGGAIKGKDWWDERQG